ncbi:peptidoglycan glycosyltransferase MrdB [soil metagenome]
MVVDRLRPAINRFHLDPPLLTGVLILCAMGLLVLYSAGGQQMEVVIGQGVKMAAGLGIMVGMAQIHPAQFRRWAPGFYAIGVALLGLVMLLGTGRGAQRWLDLGVLRFQPSELMKIAVPMMVCWYLSNAGMAPSFRRTFVTLGIVVIPAALIAEQPDLGTATLVAATGLSVLFLAGVSWRLLGVGAIVIAAGAPVLWYCMHEYQRQRLLTLLDPENDPLGSGYHIIQSMIAVGSGGLYGKGWLNGTQSHLEFLPERSTDFIFAVLCEEFGLMGVLLLLSVYLFVILRGFTIALAAQESFVRLFAGSLTITLFIYIFVNMGMVVGQLPVVGIPLPFISYGGTSLVTLLASFGILMSIHTHKRLLSN